MKKLVMLIALGFAAISCGVPKTVIQSKKVIKGQWLLNSITYDQSGTYNMTVFNDTSKECFEGSLWRFIPNNNTGTYSIGGDTCPNGDRNFIFTIQEVDADSGYYDFLLKPTNEKGKSETNVGFRVRLTQLSESNMQWEQNVMVDGKPFAFKMNFSKTE
ncbi:MAG: lipocalin family protein [Patiriisocius sp.]|uniref:lipocalin family protein n=1 Tax=Patiriisocius sp. TaxID=2822396 RepID=UPI003EF33542